MVSQDLLSPRANESFESFLKRLPPNLREIALSDFTDEELDRLEWDWPGYHARPNQILPGTEGAADSRGDWLFWLLLAGRGFGKTRTGAETVKEWARNPAERILMIAPTALDVRETMIEGPSGLLSCYPEGQKPHWNSSRHLVKFPSGAIGITRSAEEPERLRGPQFGKFWAEELCAWNYLQDAWDQLMFGFRVKGKRLQGVITTTPKPHKVLKELKADPSTVVTGGSSHDNRENLSDIWYEKVIKPFEGTRLGRQEIYAEILEDVEGALWTRKLIDDGRSGSALDPNGYARIVVAIDPSVTAGPTSSECGIMVVGLRWDGHVDVLEDGSARMSPGEWARKAINLYLKWKGDCIVGEVNNGGDLVEGNLRSVNPTIPFRSVRASRGKLVRAEPVANLYEQGRVHHWVNPNDPKHLGALEDQMVTYVPLAGMDSPDRMDALVWGITELLIDTEEMPSQRSLVVPVRISRY